MDYNKLIWLSKLCALGEKILAGEEFVEIRLGEHELGGANLRIKGNVIYCNVPDVGVFSQEIPSGLMNKAEDLLNKLKTKLEEATTPG